MAQAVSPDEFAPGRNIGLGYHTRGQAWTAATGIFGEGFDSIFQMRAQAQRKPRCQGRAAEAGLRSLRVLIADGNASSRGILQDHLSAWGLSADGTQSGSVALERLRAPAVRRAPYDWVFMDRQMPIMDGYTATEVIRKHQAIGSSERRPARVVEAPRLKPGGKSRLTPTKNFRGRDHSELHLR